MQNDSEISVKRLFQQSISAKLAAFIIGTVILQSCIFFYISSQQIKHHHVDDKKGHIQSQLANLQENLQYLSANNSSEQIQKIVSIIGANIGIRGAIFVDNNGIILASTRIDLINKNINHSAVINSRIISLDLQEHVKDYLKNIHTHRSNSVWESKNNRSLYGLSPITLGRLSDDSIRDDKVGVIVLHYDIKSFSQESQILLKQLIIPFVFILALSGLFAAIYFNFSVSRRIKLVAKSAHNFVNAEKNFCTEVKGHDEISDLCRSFNVMATKVQEEHERLQRSEQNLSITLHSIGDAVITTDTSGNVTGMNPVAEKLTGHFLADIKGEPVTSIFSIIDASTRLPITNPVETVITTGETVYLSNHTTLIAKDGTEYHIADSAAAIKNDAGEIHGMVLIFNDVTEQYRLRTKLRDTLYRNTLHWNESPLGMIEWSADFKFIDINPAAEKIFSLNKEDVIGKHPTVDSLTSFKTVEISRTWDKLLKNQTGRHDILKLEINNGKTIICDFYSTPLVNENNDIIGVTSLVMDITEHRRLEKAEKNSRRLLRQLLDDMLSMIITLTPDGTVTYVNKVPLELTSSTLKDIVGLKLWECPWFTDNELLGEQIKADTQLSSKGEKTGKEIELVTKMGTLWIDYNIHPIWDEQGHVSYLVAEAIDVSSRKQAEQQLARTQKMEALSQIVGGIAHDYNNMLGVIIGYADLLKRKYSQVEEANKFVDEIAHAANRGQKLTKRMLSFSRQESIDATLVDINHILHEMEDALEKSLTPAIQIKYKLTNEHWFTWLDTAEFEDAIFNLAINAKHAMPEGGSLTISTENIHIYGTKATALNLAENFYIKVSITDTGSGIKKAHLEKVFEPFFTTKGQGGSGLGLSQVYSFVNRSGGAIRVSSEINSGTQLTLYFPRHLQNAANTPQLSTHALQDQDIGGDEIILVVDDEPALRELARLILEDAGYTVLIANDGNHALDILDKEHNISLVISDVVMPSMDGFSLTRIVLQRYPDIKIQLISGFAFDNSIDDIDSSITDSILSKPYSADTLLQKVRQLLNKKSTSSENHDG